MKSCVHLKLCPGHVFSYSHTDLWECFAFSFLIEMKSFDDFPFMFIFLTLVLGLIIL